MDTWEFDIGVSSDPGRQRSNEPNQDRVAVIMPDINHGHPPLLILADGMGGHGGGEEASKIVIDIVSTSYLQCNPHTEPRIVLVECINKAHQALRNHAVKNPRLASFGSTVVIMLLENGGISTANVGDSRAYLFHRGEILQLSQDHSVVADQVRAGQLTPLQALKHPHRNRLTQSMSAKRDTIRPFLNHAALTTEDVFLLCSDGLWGVVAEAIIQAVAIELPPQRAADKLVSLANAANGPDNISVIVGRRRGSRLRSVSDVEESE